MQKATTYVQMYLSGSWTDISADVLKTPYIRWRTGFDRDDPIALLADSGFLEFWLNNSSKNSASTSGYYSPGHASCRAGFELGARVRIKTTRSASDRYQFHGRISEIRPSAGSLSGRRTRVVVTDYLEEMDSRYISILDIQTNKTSDQLITTLVNSMDIAPLATSYDTGVDTFPSAFHDLQGEQQVASTVAQKIIQSDMSRLYVRGDATGGETLVLANRQTDVGKTSQLTLADTMSDLQIERRRANIANKFVVAFRPIGEGTTNEILYLLPDEIELGAGKSYTFTALYRDPDGGARICGKTMVTPVADTDYKMSTTSGSGNNLNAFMTVSLNSGYATGGDRAEVTITNTHTLSTGYVWLFNLRGIAVRLRDAVEVKSEDAASIATHGEKRLEQRTPYQNSFNLTKDIADFQKNKWANPVYVINSVTYTGNRSSALMDAAVNVDIGDMITITEAMTGISEEKIVIGRTVTITSGGIWNVEYVLKDSDGGNYWLLGTSGSSEIGETTTLGF